MSLTQVVVLLLGVVAWGAFSFIRNRAGNRGREIVVQFGARPKKVAPTKIEVLIFDGAFYRTLLLDSVVEGVAWNKAIFPFELLRPLHLSDGKERYILAVSAPHLAEHRSLEAARDAVFKGRVFKPGGDLTELLRLASAIIMIGAALWVSSTISGLSNNLVNMTVRLQKVEETLSRPLIALPLPTPTRTRPQ